MGNPVRRFFFKKELCLLKGAKLKTLESASACEKRDGDLSEDQLDWPSVKARLQTNDAVL
jgi:hypothetical protein